MKDETSLNSRMCCTSNAYLLGHPTPQVSECRPLCSRNTNKQMATFDGRNGSHHDDKDNIKDQHVSPHSFSSLSFATGE